MVKLVFIGEHAFLAVDSKTVKFHALRAKNDAIYVEIKFKWNVSHELTDKIQVNNGLPLSI